jgi:transcriptional antiterminator RfaH
MSSHSNPGIIRCCTSFESLAAASYTAPITIFFACIRGRVHTGLLQLSPQPLIPPVILSVLHYGTLMRNELPPKISTTNWFAAQIRPNGTKIAQRNLERQGFLVFAPLLELTHKRRGKFVTILQPLFHGYIFVQFDPDTAPWRSINGTYGVSRLISFRTENLPTMIPPSLIAELKLRCDKNGVYQAVSMLEPGDQVRITRGPFAEFSATVTRLSSQDRVWLLLDILGGQTAIRLPRDVLKTA